MKRSKSGSITAGVWFVVDGHGFPEEGWSDFVVVILTWWLHAVTRMEQGSSAEVFDFMDGAYCLDCRAETSRVLLEGRIERRTKTDIAFVTDVAREDFLSSVVSAASQVRTLCRARGWDGRDVADLEAAINEACTVSPSLCQH